MQFAVNRALHRALRRPFIYSAHAVLSSQSSTKSTEYDQFNLFRSFYIFAEGNNIRGGTSKYAGQFLLGSRVQRLLCTNIEKAKENPTEAVQELYQKIVKSLESKRLPPNTLRDSFLKKCENAEDVKLAFEVLEKLRTFKMAGLCQHENWPKQITLAVAAACCRGNAPDIGLRTLWRHNVYGLTPDVSAAHSLLLYSKKKKDITLMRRILRTMKKNFLKPLPETAYHVLSILFNTQHWKLTSVYARQFLKDGVKLHRDSYDMLISSAANLGNNQEVWKIQKLRLESGFRHTVWSAFACAKAYLLKGKPQEAADVILELNWEDLPESKKLVNKELKLLVDKWPGMLISNREEGSREALFTELKDCISMMFSCLLNKGFEVPFNVEERFSSKAIEK